MRNKNYQQLQFSMEEEEKLVNLVKTNPCLYVLRNENYKDVEFKENVWINIAHALNKNVSDCKMKWKHIRDYYQRQKREGKPITGSGSGTGSANKYESLKFLEDSAVERPKRYAERKHKEAKVFETIENVIVTDTDNPPQQVLPHGHVMEVDLHHQDWEPQHKSVGGYQDDSCRSPSPHQPSRVIQTRTIRPQTRHKTAITSRGNMFMEIQKGRKERLNLLRKLSKRMGSKSHPAHPIDLFFQSMAAIVKNFPPTLMTVTRTKVCNLIGELELQSLREQEATNAISRTFPTCGASSVSTFSQPSSP